jgi:hypothetical protein
MSLGWLSESTILPKRAKRIEGVTTNTLVNLKAALYDSQAKKTRVAPPRAERSAIVCLYHLFTNFNLGRKESRS